MEEFEGGIRRSEFFYILGDGASDRATRREKGAAIGGFAVFCNSAGLVGIQGGSDSGAQRPRRTRGLSELSNGEQHLADSRRDGQSSSGAGTFLEHRCLVVAVEWSMVMASQKIAEHGHHGRSISLAKLAKV